MRRSWAPPRGRRAALPDRTLASYQAVRREAHLPRALHIPPIAAEDPIEEGAKQLALAPVSSAPSLHHEYSPIPRMH